MSSFLRRMQLRNVRAKDAPTARRLRGQSRGRLLGVTNPRAPKPYSNGGHGSRRGTNKRPFRMEHAKPAVIKFATYRAPTRAERKLDHRYKMSDKGYCARPVS